MMIFTLIIGADTATKHSALRARARKNREAVKKNTVALITPSVERQPPFSPTAVSETDWRAHGALLSWVDGLWWRLVGGEGEAQAEIEGKWCTEMESQTNIISLHSRFIQVTAQASRACPSVKVPQELGTDVGQVPQRYIVQSTGQGSVSLSLQTA